MFNLVLLITTPFILAFLFPEEVLDWIKRAKRKLRDDFKRRVTPKQWKIYQDEWMDVDP